MRLIDADKIHITITGGRRNGKHELSDAIEKAINKAFQEATPVEAVPISWLENFRDGLDTLSESQLMRAIDLIIDAYRVEKKRSEE